MRRVKPAVEVAQRRQALLTLRLSRFPEYQGWIFCLFLCIIHTWTNYNNFMLAYVYNINSIDYYK